jgi:hypothetical protein
MTKKEKYAVISDIVTAAEASGISIPEETTYTELKEFLSHEVELIETRTAAAQARSAKRKAEGDALREQVFEVIPTDEYVSVFDIQTALNDPNVTTPMITARLTQLINAEMVVKDTTTMPPATESGRSRKITVYKKA